MPITQLPFPPEYDSTRISAPPRRSDSFKDLNPDYDGSESSEYLYGGQAKMGRLALMFADTDARMFGTTRNVKQELSNLLFDQMIDAETSRDMMFKVVEELLKQYEPTVLLDRQKSRLDATGGRYTLRMVLFDAASGGFFPLDAIVK